MAVRTHVNDRTGAGTVLNHPPQGAPDGWAAAQTPDWLSCHAASNDPLDRVMAKLVPRQDESCRVRDQAKEAAVSTPAPQTTRHSVKNMVRVPAGRFMMGSNDFYPEERPIREAAVAEFWIDEHPPVRQGHRARHRG